MGVQVSKRTKVKPIKGAKPLTEKQIIALVKGMSTKLNGRVQVAYVTVIGDCGKGMTYRFGAGQNIVEVLQEEIADMLKERDPQTKAAIEMMETLFGGLRGMMDKGKAEKAQPQSGAQ